jgi:phosphoribosyl-ATP pyrophosphohydrolase
MNDSLPLVVCGPDGRPIGLLEENEKGYRKSLEQGHLWALHPGTGRLLPFYETIGVTVVEREGWYEAILNATPEGGFGGHAANTAPSTGNAPGAASTAPGGGDVNPAPTEGGTDTRPHIGDVLTDLAGVIASRHAELPEGSYTTHLFTSGAEKIRKKTGEEAVELLLASTRETLVSESADLIYHLLVLLESEDISLGELAAELKRR